jgi:hypothetical protein
VRLGYFETKVKLGRFYFLCRWCVDWEFARSRGEFILVRRDKRFAPVIFGVRPDFASPFVALRVVAAVRISMNPPSNVDLFSN